MPAAPDQTTAHDDLDPPQQPALIETVMPGASTSLAIPSPLSNDAEEQQHQQQPSPQLDTPPVAPEDLGAEGTPPQQPLPADIPLSDMGPQIAAEANAPVPQTTPAPAQSGPVSWPSPEEVRQLKASNPLLSYFSDEEAAAIVFAHRAPAAEVESHFAAAKQHAPGAYSLWNDLRSMPGAVWRGALKGTALEPYDFVNEAMLGNEANYGEWRKDFEAYYKAMPQGSRVVGAFAQFGASYIGLGKVARLAGILRPATTIKGSIAQAAVRGAVTDALAFDGREARLSDLLREYAGARDAVTAYLASSPTDTEAEGRLKNMIEGLGIGVTVDVILHSARALKALRNGKVEDADAFSREAEEALKAVNQGKGLKPAVQRALEPEVPPPAPQALTAPQSMTATTPPGMAIQQPPPGLLGRAANDASGPSLSPSVTMPGGRPLTAANQSPPPLRPGEPPPPDVPTPSGANPTAGPTEVAPSAGPQSFQGQPPLSDASARSVQTALERFERMKRGPNGVTKPMGEWWSQITGKAKATEADVEQSVTRALQRFERLNTPATISDEGIKLTIKPQASLPSPTVLRPVETPSTPEVNALATRLRPANDPLPTASSHKRHPPPVKGIHWETDRAAEEAFLREGTGTVVDRIRALGYDVRVGRDTGFNGEGFQNKRRRIVGIMRGRSEDYARKFGLNLDNAKRRILEHEEIHVLRDEGKLSEGQWKALLAAGKEMRIEWGGREAFARDGSPIASVDDLIRKTGDYEDWYRSQGMTAPEIKEALDQEVVAFMVGSRVAGELPNTPLFREAAEIIGAIRDSSIVAKAIAPPPPSSANLQAAVDGGSRTGPRVIDELPRWTPRPIDESTPIRPMSDPSHPGTTRLTRPDKALVDGVVDDIISKTLRGFPEGSAAREIPTPSRFDSLTHEGHMRAVIEATERRLIREMPESFAARGRVSFDETYRLAQSWGRQLGQEPGEILNRLTRESDSITNIHARLFALRQYTTSLAEELHLLARQLDPQNLSPEFGAYGSREAAETALRDKVAHYVMVQDTVGGMISEVGRTMNALRRSRRPNQQIDFASTAADAPLDKIVERIKVAGSDPEAIGRALSPTRYEALRDFVQTAWLRSILSGFETHGVNVLSSAIGTTMHPLYKVIGGYGLGNREVMAEGVRQYSYMLGEASTVFGYAVDSFKKGRPQLDPHVNRYGQFPSDHMDPRRAFGINPDAVKEGGMSARNIAETTVGKAIELYGGALDVVSTRLLSAQDELFKRAAYHAEVMAAASTEGMTQGLKGAELETFVRSRLDASFIDDPQLGRIPNLDDPLAQRAIEVARSSTFMNHVPHDSLMGTVKQFVNKYPSLKFAVPFPSIIHNLLHYSGSLTPGIAHMSKAYREAIAAGGHRAAVATGKLYVGYSIWTLALGAVIAGKSKGAGPTDAHGRPNWGARQMLEQRGEHNLGLNVGGVSINMKRMDPFGIIFNVPAIVAERLDDFNEEELASWATVFALSVAESVTSRHVMQGVDSLINAFQDTSGKGLQRWLTNIGASIAVPNVINQVNNYFGDPMIREAADFFEAAQKRLPVASEGLAARRTPWGETMEKIGGIVTSHKHDDALLNEYARLVDTGNKGIPEPLPKTKTIPGEKKALNLVEFRLSNGQRLYDLYGDRIKNPLPGQAKPLRQVLQDYIKSDAYQRQLIDGPGDQRGTRLHALRTIIGRYRDAAWKTILRDHPEVVERVYGKRRSMAEQIEQQRRATQLEAYGLGE